MDINKERLYKKRAELIQAAAHPIRLAIIDLLSNGERCVCEIAQCVDAKRSNVSRHLSVMSSAGVLECRKEGLNIYYSLKAECILNFLKCVDQILLEKINEEAQMLKEL